MVETSEREMVKKIEGTPVEEKFTSLQPTYEDTIAPDPENDWEYED